MKSTWTGTIVWLLCDYATKNSCVVYGPNTWTTVPYYSSATTDVLDIVITKDVFTPVYLIMCFALSSDYLHIQNYTLCWSYFLNRSPPDRTDLRTLVQIPGLPRSWAPIQPEAPEMRWLLTRVSRNCQAIFRKWWQSPLPRVAHDDPWPPITACIQGEKILKNRLRRQWQTSSDPALNAEANHLQRSVTYQLNEWRNDQRSSTLESLDPEDQSCGRWLDRRWKSPLLHLLWLHRGTCSLGLQESQSSCRQPGGSVSPGKWPVITGRHWGD